MQKNISWNVNNASFPYFKHNKLAIIQYLKVKLADQIVTDFLPGTN